MRIWLGIAIVAAGLVLAAFVSESRPGAAVAGTVIVIGLLTALVPWGRIRTQTRPSDGLWDAPATNQRWCSGCGRPAAPVCVNCGSKSRTLRRTERDNRRVQRKALRKNQ